MGGARLPLHVTDANGNTQRRLIRENTATILTVHGAWTMGRHRHRQQECARAHGLGQVGGRQDRHMGSVLSVVRSAGLKRPRRPGGPARIPAREWLVLLVTVTAAVILVPFASWYFWLWAEAPARYLTLGFICIPWLPGEHGADMARLLIAAAQRRA